MSTFLERQTNWRMNTAQKSLYARIEALAREAYEALDDQMSEIESSMLTDGPARYSKYQLKSILEELGDKLAHWDAPLPHKRIVRVRASCDDAPAVIHLNTCGVRFERGAGLTVFLSDGSRIRNPHLKAA